ncbi:MAG: hypothetical protein ACRC7O_19185 [Fimbriiglobus sp.]
MSRHRLCASILAVAAVGAAGFAGGRAATDRPANPTDIPHLWRWTTAAVPRPNRASELQLVVRVRADTNAGRVLPHPSQPLTAAEGDDRVLASDVLVDTRTDARVTLQLLDIRTLGFAPSVDRTPLRVLAGLRSQGAVYDAGQRLQGVAIRGAVVIHDGVWAADECPLLTVATVDHDYQYTHTFLLAVVPHFARSYR